jgi:UDP-N-acetylmuramoylalanine--D-glutamate ligase
MKPLKDKKITVLGAARSGVAVAKLLKRAGAFVFVSESNEPHKNILMELSSHHIPYETGGHGPNALTANFAVLSPGIPVNAEIVQQMDEHKIPVYSEIEAASWVCKAPIIAITGSNGKTTTTTLAGLMIKEKYENSVIAGNMGQPFSDNADKLTPNDRAILEVSSFQMETIDRFHPKTVAVLNFSPNHLDRYDSYNAYLKAKWKITQNLNKENLLILNADDKPLLAYAQNVDCRKEFFSISGDTSCRSFYKDDQIFLNGKRLIHTNDMPLRGKHNYMNAMAAALMADSEGVGTTQMENVFRSFRGIEHRLETVAEIAGVQYINDSKATTIEALAFALQAFKRPIILIAGGKDKGSQLNRLNHLITKHVKELILIGSASAKMHKEWSPLKPVQLAETMEDAVLKASRRAEANDVVLLSPACASFDMFSSYEHRGMVFKKCVQQLKDNK